MTDPVAFDDFNEYFLNQMMKQGSKESSQAIANLDSAIARLTAYRATLPNQKLNMPNSKSNGIQKPKPESNGTNIQHVTSSETGEQTALDSFRGKQPSYMQSYAILSFMLQNPARPLGLKAISEAVTKVFGKANEASLNTKLNRWKKDGLLHWTHPDRRKITKKGEQERLSFGDLIDPAEKKRIDDILETL